MPSTNTLFPIGSLSLLKSLPFSCTQSLFLSATDVEAVKLLSTFDTRVLHPNYLLNSTLYSHLGRLLHCVIRPLSCPEFPPFRHITKRSYRSQHRAIHEANILDNFNSEKTGKTVCRIGIIIGRTTKRIGGYYSSEAGGPRCGKGASYNCKLSDLIFTKFPQQTKLR